MSATQPLLMTTNDEISGWWPSERSTKTRLKAFFNRTKLEKFTRQQTTDLVNLPHAHDRSILSFNSTPIPAVDDVKVTHDHSTWPSRTLRISQRTGKHSRLIRAQKSLPNLFQETTQPPVETMPLKHPLSPIPPPPLSTCSASRHTSRSTTNSSIHTLNSLDHLRERSFSDTQSISTTHTSFSGNANSPFHTPDSSFSSTDSCETSMQKDQRSRIMTPTEHDMGGLSTYTRKPRNGPRPAPIRTTSMDLPSTRTGDIRKPLPAVPQLPPQLDKNGRRVSIVAPLPDPGHIRKTSARYRVDSRGAITEPSTPTTPSSRPSSIRSTSSSHASDAVHKRTASYSLFPQTPSTSQARLPSAPSGITPSPPSTTKTRERATTDSRPPSRNRSSRRFGKMLALNTTATCAKALESPCSISSQEDAVKPPPPLRLAKAPARQQVLRQKSMPSLCCRSPLSGPPPDVPLPALPMEASRWVSVPLGTLR